MSTSMSCWSTNTLIATTMDIMTTSTIRCPPASTGTGKGLHTLQSEAEEAALAAAAAEGVPNTSLSYRIVSKSERARAWQNGGS